MRIAANPAIQEALSKGTLGGAASPKGVGAADGPDFAQQLKDVLGDVNDSQNKATELQTDLMTGRKPTEIHDVMIGMEKAGVALQLTLAVRNKVLEAYQEVSRMQV